MNKLIVAALLGCVAGFLVRGFDKLTHTEVETFYEGPTPSKLCENAVLTNEQIHALTPYAIAMFYASVEGDIWITTGTRTQGSVTLAGICFPSGAGR